MDADLTSFLKGRRLARACRENTMRVQLENVDENQQRLFSEPGAMRDSHRSLDKARGTRNDAPVLP